jgi:hypothetical protein
MPGWLEPRGLAVIELVGQVPEQLLRGTIVGYDDGIGIVVYESGSRVGNRVVVTTTIYPRLLYPAAGVPVTYLPCLGKEPHFDHMGSVVPPSVLRLYTPTGVEVTSSIDLMHISRMANLQPSGSSLEPFRYPSEGYGPGQQHPLPLQSDGLHIPENSGCRIAILGVDYPRLTGVFTLQFEPSVRAQVLGTQQATFGSYIGPGNVGIFTPLMQQMNSTYGHRWWRIPLNIPSGASHFLLKYPPIPGDPTTDFPYGPPYRNANRPSSGTYRLSKDTTALSADLTISAAFPLQRAWQDADQAPGSVFLPVLTDPDELEPPEYVLPAGVAYNSCFVVGNCPSSVLKQVYDAQMTVEIVYLSIAKASATGQWVPLRMGGPAWSPSSASTPLVLSSTGQPAESIGAVIEAGVPPTDTYRMFLPVVARGEPVPTGCPCGWFDGLGRMLGFWP